MDQYKNKVELVGSLTSAVQLLRGGRTGGDYARFFLKVGQFSIQCITWDTELATYLSKHAREGDSVEVEGSMNPGEYTDPATKRQKANHYIMVRNAEVRPK